MYLLVPKLKTKRQGTIISDIVKETRISYDNGNPYNIDISNLTLLEAYLKEESGISDTSNVAIHYTSFNKNTNDLIAYRVTRQETDSITDARTVPAVVSIYKGSERQGVEEGVNTVFRGMPRVTWSDNANMESDYTGHFQKDRFTHERISSLDRTGLLNVQDTLRQIGEGDDETARACRQFMQENKLTLSAHP